MNVEGVADADAQEGARHLAVEGPVAEGGAFGEPAFQLDGDQIDANGLRRAVADRRRNIGCLLRDVGFDDGLGGRSRRHHELSLHAGKLMTRHAADIGEISSARCAEDDNRARALPVMRGDLASCSGKTMSCSAPSPLIRVICTTWPSAAESSGLT